MDPIEKQERKREAWRRLRAQRRRAGALRGRVVAISLIAFALLWGVVFAQMATGNDPVLGNRPTAHSRSAGKEAAREIETTDPVEVEAQVGDPGAIEAEELESEIEPEPEPLTTSQS